MEETTEKCQVGGKLFLFHKNNLPLPLSFESYALCSLFLHLKNQVLNTLCKKV